MAHVNPYIIAVRDCDINRRVLAAKGFKSNPREHLAYMRSDADIRFDYDSRKWVCDVYMNKDGTKQPYKHVEHERLTALLRDFI